MRALLCALLLAATGLAFAQDVKGKPETSERLRDREFGVATQQFGLQRRVEMYQWRREGAGYVMDWRDAPVDSRGFDATHANPGAFPLQPRYWIAQQVMLDGKPVDDDVLKELGTWRVFRPGFSALPGNLSATFQPDGDGLSSAENPLAPQIGDLRITWRELTLPSLAGRVRLEQGSWLPAVEAGPPEAGPASAAATQASGAHGAHHRAWLLAVLCAGIALLAWSLARRRKPRGR